MTFPVFPVLEKMANLFIETLIFMSKFIYFVVEATIRNIVGIVYVPQKDVNGEIVLITGAGSGVGRLLAIKFAALGATVVLADVNREANDAVAAEILRKGQSAHAYQCDCSKRKDVYQLAAKVKETVGDVTILINNAGIVSGKKLGEIPDDKVDLTFQVNTVAHFWVRELETISCVGLSTTCCPGRVTHACAYKYCVDLGMEYDVLE